MPLSIFADGLPFSSRALTACLPQEMRRACLVPNVGYSASLHRQLYADQYPDDTGVLVDWVHEREASAAVRISAALLSPLDVIPPLGVAARKVLDRLLRRSVFANIPFRHRAAFSHKGSYLFRSQSFYGTLPLLCGYCVISQDEGNRTFDEAMCLLNSAIAAGERDIFFVTGIFDALGHTCARGDAYEQRITPALTALGAAISAYRAQHPHEEVLLLSDHGMSTLQKRVRLRLDGVLTRRERRRCTVYTDSCMACVFCEDSEVRQRVAAYLDTLPFGHRLDGRERALYRVRDPRFGDELFLLREGFVFADSWFGVSWRPRPQAGEGMHGFYPEKAAVDQLACVALLSEHRALQTCYDYPSAHALVCAVMQGEAR